MFQGSDPRMNASSAGQSRCQKKWSDIKSNVSDDSTNGGPEISKGKTATIALNTLQLTL